MARHDVNATAGNFDRPVLVLSGMQDLSSTPEMMRATADVYRRSEFRTVDPGTHMMVMEQSQAVATALIDFRDATEKASRSMRVA